MHISSGYPLYCDESRQRMYYYTPPYYYNGSWYYATPWLWYDGNPHGSYQYTTWESKIVTRMNQPAPVTITMWGHYELTADTGRIYAQFRNDSTETLDGRVIVVVTEDSLYYSAPNGDVWHNHVARDYLPDQNGQVVSIPAGDSVTVDQPLSFDPDWLRYRCELVTWIQNDSMTADSVKEIWQGGILRATELTGIEEEESEEIISAKVTARPNPCDMSAAFMFSLPAGEEYQITIYDVLGRRVRTLRGISGGGEESTYWNLKNNKGSLVGAGVYLYRFESRAITTTGKIVVR